MKKQIDELTSKAHAVFEKYNDAELRDYLLDLAHSLRTADAMYHHFGYLLTHVRANVAHQSRTAHLRQAIEGAQQFLKRYDDLDSKVGARAN